MYNEYGSDEYVFCNLINNYRNMWGVDSCIFKVIAVSKNAILHIFQLGANPKHLTIIWQTAYIVRLDSISSMS